MTKKAYGLPTVQKRQMQGLPVDIGQKDTYLGLITKATEWKKGGGIQITVTLYNEDGTKVQHLNGSDTPVDIGAPMPLEGPKFAAWTRAIFAEADQFTIDAGFDLEDLYDRWVYVKLERDKKRDENEAELAQWGPRLNVTMMTPIPVGERPMIEAMHRRVLGKEPPRLTVEAETPTATSAPQQQRPAPQAAQPKSAPVTAPAAAGLDPNDPFGVGSGA